MFTTLKILAVIGGLTFLGGNSLLSNIAARRWAGDEFLFLASRTVSVELYFVLVSEDFKATLSFYLFQG